MTEIPETAAEFERLFRAVYLRFHRRDGRRSELSSSARAVLTHLSMAGPLTIGEAAEHLDRAQSVVSELVSGLEGHGLVERRSDPGDRRRTLVWLTSAGGERLRRDALVLDEGLLEAAFARLPVGTAEPLLDALRAVVDAAPAPPTRTHE